MMVVRQFPDAEAAATACAQQILDWLREALESRALASLAISGGSSPRRMFEIFATTRFEWQRVHLFWVDERAVPPSDGQSNFKFAQDAWLRLAVSRA
jgi:6-phosphogluconolactonase